MNKLNIIPIKVSILYFILGGLWIYFSDRILLLLIDDLIFFSEIQIYKGWFYVCLTSVLLYVVVLKYINRISFLAYYDNLTGLPNFYLFKEKLNKVIISSKRKDQRHAIMFLDLDRFKMVNDIMGHHVGDLLLKQVSNRVSRTVSKENLVSRQGGDEYILLLRNIEKEKAAQLAESILSVFKEPFLLEKREFFVSPSIGISLYPFHGVEVETLIKHANMAMYSAKKQGGNNFQFYVSDSLNIVEQKNKIENALRKALENNEFTLHYQPQFDLETGEIEGVEALIRWESKEMGSVPPSEFISIAEETGLIIPIGHWVIKTACMQNKVWQNQGFPKIKVAVNVSVRQIEELGFLSSVQGILNETELNPEYLSIEITESIMQDFKQSLEILIEFKKMGMQIAIDDFGTGYSSLNVLKYLPIDYIKIDQSFIRDLSSNKNTAAIVKMIIDMGSESNLKLIAEGIETERQMQFLIESRCHLGQGFLLSRPIPANEITNIFEEKNKTKALTLREGC